MLVDYTQIIFWVIPSERDADPPPSQKWGKKLHSFKMETYGNLAKKNGHFFNLVIADFIG